MKLLKFSQENAKTSGLSQVVSIAPFLESETQKRRKRVYSCDGRSGYDCPYAKLCKSKAVEGPNNKATIQDGPHTVWRCFSASQEVQYPNTRHSRKYNSDLFRACGNVKKMTNLIEASLPKDMGVCRIHVSGDFFNQRHFDAWLAIARMYRNILFYAYTKSLPFWIRRKHLVDTTNNFVLTASYGGTKDNLIEQYNLRFARVISELDLCKKLVESGQYDIVPHLGTPYDGLPIDHDDSHAADPYKCNQNFCLLLHGTQPKGSDASKALITLKGVGSYSRKKGGAK